jgi:hypothetical protein
VRPSLSGETEDRERCRRALGMPLRRDRGDPHLLAWRCGITAPVAEHRRRKRRREVETRGHCHGATRDPHVAVAQQIPCRNRKDQCCRGEIARPHEVYEPRLCGRVQQDRRKIVDPDLHAAGIEFHARGVVQPSGPRGRIAAPTAR